MQIGKYSAHEKLLSVYLEKVKHDLLINTTSDVLFCPDIMTAFQTVSMS